MMETNTCPELADVMSFTEGAKDEKTSEGLRYEL